MDERRPTGTSGLELEAIRVFGPHVARESGIRLDSGVVPDRYVKTHCCFCGQQCGMQLKVKDNTIVGVEPWYDFPFNRGMLCPKGVKRYLQQNHPDRLLHAYERDPGAPAGEIERAGEKAYRGAMLLAVVLRIVRDHPRVSVTDQMLAAGAAIENMLLAASALGYAGCLRSGHSATSRRVRLALGLANEEELAAFMMLGTPAKAPKPRNDEVPDLLSIWES